MSEDDYINLSNRVRIDAALSILRNLLPGGALDEKRLTGATATLYLLRDDLAQVARIDSTAATSPNVAGTTPDSSH